MKVVSLDLPRYVYRRGRARRPYFCYRGGPNIRMWEEPGTSEFWQEYDFLRRKSCPDNLIHFLTPDGRDHFTAMERSARNRAKRNGREHALPVGWMRERFEEQHGRCAVTALPFEKGNRKHAPYAPSIDRKDSAKGYTPENCQLVCYMVNCARNQFSDYEFLRMCRAVVRVMGTDGESVSAEKVEQNGLMETSR